MFLQVWCFVVVVDAVVIAVIFLQATKVNNSSNTKSHLKLPFVNTCARSVLVMWPLFIFPDVQGQQSCSCTSSWQSRVANWIACQSTSHIKTTGYTTQLLNSFNFQLQWYSFQGNNARSTSAREIKEKYLLEAEQFKPGYYNMSTRTSKDECLCLCLNI